MDLGEVKNLNHSDDFIFAITVGRIGEYLHCGLLYKSGKEINVIDFFNHHVRSTFTIGDLSHNGFIYVKYNEDAIFEDMAIQVPAVCELINEQNDFINFGIRFTNSGFNDEGRLILSGGDFGLTCATFVLAAMERAGLHLINYGSWQIREEDAIWQKSILEFLIKANVENPGYYPEELIKEYEKNIGCFRYRPEEVSASTSSDQLPASFEYCNSNGKVIITEIDYGFVLNS